MKHKMMTVVIRLRGAVGYLAGQLGKYSGDASVGIAGGAAANVPHSNHSASMPVS